MRSTVASTLRLQMTKLTNLIRQLTTMNFAADLLPNVCRDYEAMMTGALTSFDKCYEQAVAVHCNRCEWTGRYYIFCK